jgi:hypothetical protein
MTAVSGRCEIDVEERSMNCVIIGLGRIGESGLLVRARGRTWGKLVFQDLARSRPEHRNAVVETERDDDISPDELMGLLNTPR